MKNATRNYLAEAARNNQESFASADGFIDDDLSFTGSDDFFNAAGNGVSSGPAPTSQPYIINVVNTAGAYSNLALLGPNSVLDSATFTNGSLVITNGLGTVTISSGMPGITYQQMLFQFLTNPFTVGLTYIQSTTAGQVLQVLSVNTRDANGNQAQKPFVPTIDPYQYQSTIIAMKQAYRIDGFTQVIVNSILANASVTFMFYPADTINLARGLAGRPVSNQYGNPRIVKEQTIKLASA